MSELEDILAALELTPKGNLKYDKKWISEDLQDILEECTSPPQVTTMSGSHSFLHHSVNPSAGLSRTPCKPGGVVHACLSYSEDPGDDSDEEAVATSGKWDDVCRIKNPSPVPYKKAKNEANVAERESPVKDSLIQSPQEALTEVALKDYEDSWQKEVEASMERRRLLFHQHDLILERAAERKAMEMQLQQEQESQAAVHRARQQQIVKAEEVKKKHLKLREHHHQHKKMLETKMKEAEERKKTLEEEAKKKVEEHRQRLASIVTCIKDGQTYQSSIGPFIARCQYPDLLDEVPKNCQNLIAQIIEKMKQVLMKAQEGEVLDEHVKIAQELFRKVPNIMGILKEAIENVNKRGKEAEDRKKAGEAKAAADAAAAAASTAATASASASGQAAGGAVITPKSDEVLCVSEAAFKEYMRLQDFKNQLQQSCQPLVNNVPLKKYLFDLKKAVNIPVNAISPTSGTHLRDKLKRILELLGGQGVDVGGRRVLASENVAGVAFVKNLFAQKIVDQGNTQVASNNESAFAIAAVAVGVWCEMPDVGELLLAHFHSQCPYTVPYYKPKLPNQSREEFYTSLGYTYENGTVEQQDKFLKRMSGLIRLYASIMVSVPPRGPQHPHPHGVEEAWVWLTQTLNLEPRPDITATSMHDFLQVTGHLLWKTYGKQFLKLLRLVCTDYMPKIQAVTPQGSGGPVTRLESYLQKCINSGRIAPPDGMLPPNFWTSR